MLKICSQQWKAIWDVDTTSFPLSWGCCSDFCQIRMILAESGYQELRYVADRQKVIVPKQFLRMYLHVQVQQTSVTLLLSSHKWNRSHTKIRQWNHHQNTAMKGITLSCTLQSAPSFKRTSMTLAWPSRAAMCSAVLPSCMEAHTQSYTTHNIILE